MPTSGGAEAPAICQEDPEIAIVILFGPMVLQAMPSLGSGPIVLSIAISTYVPSRTVPPLKDGSEPASAQSSAAVTGWSATQLHMPASGSGDAQAFPPASAVVVSSEPSAGPESCGAVASASASPDVLSPRGAESCAVAPLSVDCSSLAQTCALRHAPGSELRGVQPNAAMTAIAPAQAPA
jgi:hypothetical protein